MHSIEGGRSLVRVGVSLRTTVLLIGEMVVVMMETTTLGMMIKRLGIAEVFAMNRLNRRSRIDMGLMNDPGKILLVGFVINVVYVDSRLFGGDMPD